MAEQGDLNVEIGVSLNRLAGQLARAEARFAAATKKIERDSNQGTARAADTMARNYSRGVDEAARQTMRLNDSVERVNGSFMRAGGGVQNAAYQIQDFVVQVQGGTDASRALAMQLPQLLGGFGAIGAVLGVLAGVGLPLLAAGFSDATSQADSAKTSMDNLQKTFDSYMVYVNQATTSTAELREEFGQWATAVQGFSGFLAQAMGQQTIEQMVEVAAIYNERVKQVRASVAAWGQAQIQLQATLDDQAAGLATSADVMLYSDALSVAEEAALRAADSLGLSVAQVSLLGNALDNLSGATTMAQVADAASNVLSLLEQWFPAGASMNAEVVDLATNMQALVEMAAEAATTFDRVDQSIVAAVTSMSALDRAIGGASGMASALAGNLWNAASAAFAAAANMGAAAANAALGDDERGSQREGRQDIAAMRAARALQLANQRASQYQRGPSGGGGGGGGGGGAGTDYAAEFQRLLAALDPVIRATQQFEEAQTLINEALSAGAATAEQAAHAYGLAEERFREATGALVDGQSAWRDLEEIGGNALDKLIEGTGDWRDVLIDAVKQFAIAQARAAILQSSPNANPNASLGQLIMGGLFGGFRAAGGPVDAGRAYMVGERGPEMIVPRAPGRVISNNALRSGGSSRVEIVLSPDLQARILSEAQGQSVRVTGAAIGAQSRTLRGQVMSQEERYG